MNSATMASFANAFALLNDVSEDQHIAVTAPPKAAPLKKEAPKPEAKPAAPAKASNEGPQQRSEGGRARGEGHGRGRGRGGRGRGDGRPYERNAVENGGEEAEGATEERGGRGRGYGGGRGRGGRGRGTGGDVDGPRHRRDYERHDGTGRGHELQKRGGAGKGNWGTETDAANAETEPKAENAAEEVPAGVEAGAEVAAEEAAPVQEEEKELSLEEYEQQLAEKKAALNKTREVAAVDMSAFKGMKTLEKKKEEDDTLGLELSNKKEKAAEKAKPKKESTAKTVVETGFKVGIEESRPRGGRGGRGGRGSGDGPRPMSARGRGGRGAPRDAAGPAIAINDNSAFPSLVAA